MCVACVCISGVCVLEQAIDRQTNEPAGRSSNKYSWPSWPLQPGYSIQQYLKTLLWKRLGDAFAIINQGWGPLD